MMDVLRDASARVRAGAGPAELRSASEAGAGDAWATPRSGGGGGSSGSVGSGDGSCEGPAPHSTAATAVWQLSVKPERVYWQAVRNGHWDVAAGPLPHLSPPQPNTGSRRRASR